MAHIAIYQLQLCRVCCYDLMKVHWNCTEEMERCPACGLVNRLTRHVEPLHRGVIRSSPTYSTHVCSVACSRDSPKCTACISLNSSPRSLARGSSGVLGVKRTAG